MLITFGQLFDTVAANLGRSGSCDKNDPAARLRAASLLQEYVHRSGSLKRWDLTTKNNLVTLPRDIAVILKVRINGESTTAHSKWYEFFDHVKDCAGKEDWAEGVIQEVNTFPTVYDLPCGGGYILAELGRRCGNPKGAYIIVQGLNEHGADVYTKYHNEHIHGEKIYLESGVLKRSQTFFSKITAITKVQTDDYIKLYSQSNKASSPAILSIMTAKETVAEFRRARILDSRCDPAHRYSVTVLGRVNIFSDYHDNDIIPLTELSGIETLSQAKQSLANNNVEVAGLKYQVTDRVIEDSNEYNRNSDVNINMIYELSPGSVDFLI
jgi:hypothetical protein